MDIDKGLTSRELVSVGPKSKPICPGRTRVVNQDGSAPDGRGRSAVIGRGRLDQRLSQFIPRPAKNELMGPRRAGGGGCGAAGA